MEGFEIMNYNSDHFAKIKVIGVGGGGMNAVNRMMAAGLKGVEFVAMNTDIHVLELSEAENKLQLGADLTRGLGAGGDPTMGRMSAEESKSEIKRLIDGADMIFIAAGMGGGTGTGAAPVVAELSREAGILTVAVVTKPFGFEGARRSKVAETGVTELRDRVDTLIVIPNERLMQYADNNIPLIDAFKIADDVLHQGVQGISDIITIPGMINVDFADVKTIMANQGTALMGIGHASGENKAKKAAEAACASPLLETTIDGAKGVLINITGGSDLTLPEVYEAADIIYKACDVNDVNIIFGTVIDPTMTNEVKITVVATGFDGERRNPVYTKAAAAVVGEEAGSVAGMFETPENYSAESDIEIPAFLRHRR